MARRTLVKTQGACLARVLVRRRREIAGPTLAAVVGDDLIDAAAAGASAARAGRASAAGRAAGACRAARGARVARRRAVLLVRGCIFRARLACCLARQVLELARNARQARGLARRTLVKTQGACLTRVLVRRGREIAGPTLAAVVGGGLIVSSQRIPH